MYVRGILSLLFAIMFPVIRRDLARSLEAGYRYGHGYFATPTGSDTIGIRLSATGTQSVFARPSPYGL